MTKKLALAKSKRISHTDAHARKTERWQRKFLAALATTPSVKHAVKAAGVTRDTAYRHRNENRDFADKWLEAIQRSVDDLEVVAFKKAAEGDSNLLMFMLRCHRPSIYRETSRHEVGMLGQIIFIPAKAEGAE